MGECEGDKYQERDKLRLEGVMAKLDMLWRLQTMQRNGKKELYRAPPRQSAVTPGRRGGGEEGGVGEKTICDEVRVGRNRGETT